MTSLDVRSMSPEADAAAGDTMLHQDRWEEIRRLHFEERRSVSAIARLLDLDRKTVRRCLRESAWRPYTRAPRPDTLLASYADFLRQRAPEVQYSAQILFQELRRQHGYRGGYDTVRRFVAPLRQLTSRAELCQTRFETPPGQQSQIDWSEVGTEFGSCKLRLHIFVLTLGFSCRGFYMARADERLPQFLEAHKRAFEHFGGPWLAMDVSGTSRPPNAAAQRDATAQKAQYLRGFTGLSGAGRAPRDGVDCARKSGFGGEGDSRKVRLSN